PLKGRSDKPLLIWMEEGQPIAKADARKQVLQFDIGEFTQVDYHVSVDFGTNRIVQNLWLLTRRKRSPMELVQQGLCPVLVVVPERQHHTEHHVPLGLFVDSGNRFDDLVVSRCGGQTRQ